LKSIRKLYFQNAAGQRKGLNGDNGVYATNLSGFGVTLAPSYADLSRGFFSPVSSETEPQNTLAFTMMFTRNAYDVYQSFLNWLSASETITIVYNPTGQQEYFRDVSINFLQKGELTEVGWLEIPCSFFCNTPWYMPTPTELNLIGSEVDQSKRYPYVYTDSLRYGAGSTAAISATIAGAGHVPGSLELTFYGSISNPRIRLTGAVSGKAYGVCSIAAVFGRTDTLKYSSKYEDAYVKKISASGQETDLLDALDLSSNPFFHIPVDEPCNISIEADSSFSGKVDLLIYYYYRSV
jgi:hypothetical protein